MNEEMIKFHKNYKNNPILIKYGNLTVICLKWISRLLLACGIVSFLFGLIMCVYTKSLVLTFGFQLPFINLNSLHGFIINSLFQYSVIFFAYNGFLAFVHMYFSLFIYVCTEIDIIIDSLAVFDKFIVENLNFNQKMAVGYLKAIIKLHKKNNL